MSRRGLTVLLVLAGELVAFALVREAALTAAALLRVGDMCDALVFWRALTRARDSALLLFGWCCVVAAGGGGGSAAG